MKKRFGEDSEELGGWFVFAITAAILIVGFWGC